MKIPYFLAVFGVLMNSSLAMAAQRPDAGRPNEHLCPISRTDWHFAARSAIAVVADGTEQLVPVEEQLRARRQVPASAPAAASGEVIPRPVPEVESQHSRLFYKKGTPEQVILPFPSEGPIDISGCGAASIFVSMAVGYKKAKNPANANEVEVWIAPRFLIERNADAFGAQRNAIMGAWANPACPVGLFWTWGGDEATENADHLITETPENIFANNIYANWKNSAQHGPLSSVLGVLRCQYVVQVAREHLVHFRIELR